jgi:hypothetical protein
VLRGIAVGAVARPERVRPVNGAAEQVERFVDQLRASCDVLDMGRPYPCLDASQRFPCDVEV